MRRPTKTSLKRKLDKLVSEIVRKRRKCEHCGKKENLQCAHIFPRTCMNLRFSLDNCLVLCLRCHLYWAHKNPIEFAEWVKKYLGEDKYELLKKAHYKVAKYTIDDLQTKLKILEEGLNGRKGKDERKLNV